MYLSRSSAKNGRDPDCKNYRQRIFESSSQVSHINSRPRHVMRFRLLIFAREGTTKLFPQPVVEEDVMHK
jgi:hypothetical protein